MRVAASRRNSVTVPTCPELLTCSTPRSVPAPGSPGYDCADAAALVIRAATTAANVRFMERTLLGPRAGSRFTAGVRMVARAKGAAMDRPQFLLGVLAVSAAAVRPAAAAGPPAATRE